LEGTYCTNGRRYPEVAFHYRPIGRREAARLRKDGNEKKQLKRLSPDCKKKKKKKKKKEEEKEEKEEKEKKKKKKKKKKKRRRRRRSLISRYLYVNKNRS
jgi:hypothetical protein